MRLRSHLQVLTLGTLLPVVVFGLAAATVIAERERELVRRGGTERTLALLTAVDAELSGYAQSLQALAASSSLARGDLAAFHVEARRALVIQSGWRDVRLATPDGRVVLDAAEPYGTAPARVREHSSFEDVVTTEGLAIRNLYPEPDGSHQFGVRAPVIIDDSVHYILSALVDPAEMHALLDRQRIPADWVGIVLDANSRIVARTMQSDVTVGRLAAVDLRDALSRRSEGWFRGRLTEGVDVYVPYTRSIRSGWTVAIGIPVSAVHSNAAEMGWLFAAGIVAALLAALLLANGLSRRVLRPMASLAAAARAIGRGEPVDPPTSAGVREVREVSHVLARAATRVREREAALWAADQAKDEFIAMLGHELRNPLSALMSAAKILHLSGSANEGAGLRAAEVIDRQVRHMTRLVEDLLDVSRLTTGKVKLEFEPLDLSEAVRSVLETFETGGQLRNHEVQVDLASVWVEADRSRMEQVIANLLGNAVKYTPDGGRISIRVRGRSEEGSEAVLEVEDTGAGLPPDLAPRVFESFVQGERALDRKAGGLGLGLTLVRSMVDRHRGTVTAHSEGPGLGTCFTVRIPAIAPPEPDEAEAVPVPDERPTRGRCRVLVVEDNDDARETLTVALEFAGHEVITAPDGERGLQMIRELQPDVAVVDIGLPRMDGFELARRLREEGHTDGAAARPVRLVALTGYSQEETRTRALSAGFDRSLTKPVGMDELTKIIDELTSEAVGPLENGTAGA